MRRFLIEKCDFTRRLVNKTCLFRFYYRTAQPHERCNTSLLCALIYQLRKGSDAARRKSTLVFSFKVHSCFCCPNSLFLEPLKAQSLFKSLVLFTVICWSSQLPHSHSLSGTSCCCCYCQLLGGKKKKQSTAPPRHVILHISPIEAAFHIIKLLQLLLSVLPAELLVGPVSSAQRGTPFKIAVILNWDNNHLSLSSLLSQGFQ